jgi:intein/homing endonuclease
MQDTVYEEFIAKSRYARYLEEEGRRENWSETVARYFEFMQAHLVDKYDYIIPEDTLKELQDAVTAKEVLPSMRALMTAGDALDRDNVAGYNCAFLPVDDPKSFDEAMYILMCGTGIGFSVERQYIKNLPEVPEKIFPSKTYIMVHDSKEGWAKALRQLISLLYAGEAPKWDVSEVRPAGAPLKVFGGRASGPGPLEDLFRFVTKVFIGSQGRKLTSLECHDIMCKIGEVVVVGGVRRCLPVGTLINTTKGSKAIENIVIGDSIVTGGKAYKVTGQVYSGKQKLLNINHRFGTLKCTENHMVAYYTGLNTYEFKKASELVEGDRLVWDSLGYDGEDQKLPISLEKAHFNAKPFNIPESINEEISWLFGLIHGDGYVGPKGIEITSALHEDANLISANRIFGKYFDVTGNITKGHGNCLRLRVNSSSLARWFAEHIKQPKNDIRIPSFIMNASRTTRFAYLAGLFDADGGGKEDGRIEQCTTIYPKFHKDIVQLLSTLGIGCSVYFGDTSRRRAEGVGCQDFFTISITGNTNRRNWLDGVSGYLATNKLYDNSFSFSGPVDFSYPVSLVSKELDTTGYKVDGNINISSKQVPASNYHPTTITSIIAGDDEVDTYDIEVAEVAQFTVGGIVVHNSAMISLSNLSDDRMRHAKAGAWWETNGQRALANNSACYTEKPDVGIFMQEWLALYESKSGERGIFNREAAQKIVRKNGRRKDTFEFGTNPCS